MILSVIITIVIAIVTAFLILVTVVASHTHL
jgi:hypothetical protein